LVGPGGVREKSKAGRKKAVEGELEREEEVEDSEEVEEEAARWLLC
jgi:hypothetical protein